MTNGIFGKAVEFVLAQEGGISEDPNDPGQLTKFGISQRAYPDLDIRQLTREDAIKIYKADYWDRMQCGEFTPAIAVILFDAAVNQGQKQAIRLLQAALGVRNDGVIGAETIHASYIMPAVTEEFVARRIQAYGLHPQFARYGLGWARRIARIHALALDEVASEGNYL